MINLVLKHDVGQEVYFMNANLIIRAKVHSINVWIDSLGKITIKYRMVGSAELEEHLVFPDTASLLLDLKANADKAGYVARTE